MNCEQMQVHLADVLAGTAPESARSEANAHLAGCEECRKEYEEVQAAWDRLSLLPAESPSPHLRTRFYDTLEAYQQGAQQGTPISSGSRWATWLKTFRAPRTAPQWAAAAVLLAVGLGAGLALNRVYLRPADSGQVTSLRKEVDHMRELVILSLLQQQSPSDRMQGVSFTAQAPTSATEVTTALLKTMQEDPSVSVRLAAVDALQKFSSNAKVRDALMQSLPAQDSPLVQIAMIDLLTQIRERKATAVFAQLAGSTSTNQSVRERAVWATQQFAPRVE